MFDTIRPFVLTLANGLAVSLAFFLIGSIGSLILGLSLALGLRSHYRLIRLPIQAYVEFFRNTPLLVQLFWLHFALPSVTGIVTSAVQTAGLALVLVMSAYMAEVYRAGIGSVPQGQLEATDALGLPRWLAWRFVVIPQVLRVALPSIGNTLIALLKATAVLSVLAVPDLMRATTRISDYTARPVLFYTLAAVIYIGIGLIVTALIHRFEKRLQRAG